MLPEIIELKILEYLSVKPQKGVVLQIKKEIFVRKTQSRVI